VGAFALFTVTVGQGAGGPGRPWLRAMGCRSGGSRDAARGIGGRSLRADARACVTPPNARLIASGVARALCPMRPGYERPRRDKRPRRASRVSHHLGGTNLADTPTTYCRKGVREYSSLPAPACPGQLLWLGLGEVVARGCMLNHVGVRGMGHESYVLLCIMAPGASQTRILSKHKFC